MASLPRYAFESYARCLLGERVPSIMSLDKVHLLSLQTWRLGRSYWVNELLRKREIVNSLRVNFFSFIMNEGERWGWGMIESEVT